MARKPKQKSRRDYKEEAEQYTSVEDFMASVEASSDNPSRDWLMDNFKSKSAIIRYLALEKKKDVKTIVDITGFEYRHVYSVVAKSKHQQVPDHVCPVCMNRKG